MGGFVVNSLFTVMQPSQIILHEIAVVIVGKTHNPSILNPDFLRHNNIVPKEMKPAAGPADVVSTPVGSRIAYEDGLEIVGDPQKIVFTESVFGKPREDIIVPDAAKAYLRTVPHVRYVAVGVNPEGHAPAPDSCPPRRPGALLRAGEWAKFKEVSPSAEIELKYPMKRKIFTVKVAATEVGAPVNAKDALVFRGNFHRVIEDADRDSHQRAIAAVGEWEDDLNEFRQLAEQIAGELT